MWPDILLGCNISHKKQLHDMKYKFILFHNFPGPLSNYSDKTERKVYHGIHKKS